MAAVSFCLCSAATLVWSAVGADLAAVVAAVGCKVGDWDSNSMALIQLFIRLHRLVTGRWVFSRDPITGVVFDTTLCGNNQYLTVLIQRLI